MSETVEKRLERVEAELAALKRRLDAAVGAERSKDWRRTFGMSANDPDFDEMIRLGKEYRQAQRAEDEPDADPGH